MQSSWVDRIFEKLAIRYGAMFMDQYREADIEAVKRDWAEVLDGVQADSVSFAFAYLPFEKAPNAMQFREICRKAPRREELALPAPVADPERVREIVGKLKKPIPAQGTGLALQCMRNIERVTNGGKMSAAQKHVYESCRRMVEGNTQAGEAA